LRNCGSVPGKGKSFLLQSIQTDCEAHQGSYLMGKKVKFSLSTPRRHTMGIKVQLHTFLTSVLVGDEWLTSLSLLYPWQITLVPTE
jgi:hypothetical protein